LAKLGLIKQIYVGRGSWKPSDSKSAFYSFLCVQRSLNALLLILILWVFL